MNISEAHTDTSKYLFTRITELPIQTSSKRMAQSAKYTYKYTIYICTKTSLTFPLSVPGAFYINQSFFKIQQCLKPFFFFFLVFFSANYHKLLHNDEHNNSSTVRKLQQQKAE